MVENMKNIFRFNGEHYVRITPVQQLKARIAELEEENKRLEDESEKIIDINADLSFKICDLEKENTVFNENNANLAFKVEELESDINMLNNTNEDLRAEIDDWRNQ